MIEITSTELLKELAYEADITLRKTYSGRGMYGAQCFGIVGRLRDLLTFVMDIVPQLDDDDTDSIDWTDVRSDNMGHDMIYYWPDVQWPSGDVDDD